MLIQGYIMPNLLALSPIQSARSIGDSVVLESMTRQL
jgi:hypothetical protein